MEQELLYINNIFKKTKIGEKEPHEIRKSLPIDTFLYFTDFSGVFKETAVKTKCDLKKNEVLGSSESVFKNNVYPRDGKELWYMLSMTLNEKAWIDVTLRSKLESNADIIYEDGKLILVANQDILKGSKISTKLNIKPTIFFQNRIRVYNLLNDTHNSKGIGYLNESIITSNSSEPEYSNDYVQNYSFLSNSSNFPYGKSISEIDMDFKCYQNIEHVNNNTTSYGFTPRRYPIFQWLNNESTLENYRQKYHFCPFVEFPSYSSYFNYNPTHFLNHTKHGFHSHIKNSNNQTENRKSNCDIGSNLSNQLSTVEEVENDNEKNKSGIKTNHLNCYLNKLPSGNLNFHTENDTNIKSVFIDSIDDKEGNSGEYLCKSCGKLFSYKAYLIKHQKYSRCVDNGKRKFPCKFCTRSFDRNERLKVHIMHVHEKLKPYVCKECNKAFSQSSSLNKHMRTHTGERPYSCDFCQKMFSASSILRTHRRQHTGEKPFKCCICKRDFASHASLDSHLKRIHVKETKKRQ